MVRSNCQAGSEAPARGAQLEFAVLLAAMLLPLAHGLARGLGSLG